MTFEDLKELGDEEAVKKAGKLRQQGKKYVVQDADVIYFKVSSMRQGRAMEGRNEGPLWWRWSVALRGRAGAGVACVAHEERYRCPNRNKMNI